MQLDLSPEEHATVIAMREKAAKAAEKKRALEDQQKRFAADAEDRRARRYAKALELRDGGMGCNCDLDNWEPERTTGHSWVCRIHKAVLATVN